MSLAENLQNSKNSLEEFKEITIKVLEYLPHVINEERTHQNYKVCSSNIAGTRKQLRPFNQQLFIRELSAFVENFNLMQTILEKLRKGQREFTENDYLITDKTIYTIQQAIGLGLDLLCESNSARKHVGNRFEELIKVLLSEINISLKKIVINIPYETDEGIKYYKCETDVVVSPFKEVKSNSHNIDQDELIISLKTTTKDRMSKIFIDKILLESFLKHPVRVIGISQNDIQRKGSGKISYTFVSNLFMVYTKFLIQLEGYYYLDRPAKAFEKPFNQYIFPFSHFLLNDIWKLLRT
ncbi:MAG: hypothetical protein IPH62_06215 [Ignavibacteriae bacterium]|nr:hypothetical protein [Ignavibacteriota bacterium]